MRHIKTYGIWEGKGKGLTPEQANFLNEHIKGTWSVNLDGEVDVKGDFDCSYSGVDSFFDIRFGLVSGNFLCRDNRLTSLVGAPREVGGAFNCGNNLLTTLEGAPQEVEGDFICKSNKLTSLEGVPREVRGNFYCGGNQLTSLVGAPLKVGGDYIFMSNQLTSLVGSPREVERDFYCGYNQITSLVGAPLKVGGNFSCINNQLTSLEGAPREVGGGFYFSDNPVSRHTIILILEYMRKNPDLPYGAVLLALRNKITPDDWNKLDKSAIDRLSDKAQKGYKLLGGIGGI